MQPQSRRILATWQVQSAACSFSRLGTMKNGHHYFLPLSSSRWDAATTTSITSWVTGFPLPFLQAEEVFDVAFRPL